MIARPSPLDSDPESPRPSARRHWRGIHFLADAYAQMQGAVPLEDMRAP